MCVMKLRLRNWRQKQFFQCLYLFDGFQLIFFAIFSMCYLTLLQNHRVENERHNKTEKTGLTECLNKNRTSVLMCTYWNDCFWDLCSWTSKQSVTWQLDFNQAGSSEKSFKSGRLISGGDQNLIPDFEWCFVAGSLLRTHALHQTRKLCSQPSYKLSWNFFSFRLLETVFPNDWGNNLEQKTHTFVKVVNLTLIWWQSLTLHWSKDVN